MPFKSPKAIVETACTAGCSKTELTVPKQLVMGILAGAYIAIGGLLAIVVGRGSPALAAANPGLGKFLFAAVFPVGLMLVVIAGSELFTGNCGVITPSCLTGRARWQAMFRNWGVVYVGNFIGSIFVALFLAFWSGIVKGGALGDGVAGVPPASGVGILPTFRRQHAFDTARAFAPATQTIAKLRTGPPNAKASVGDPLTLPPVSFLLLRRRRWRLCLRFFQQSNDARVLAANRLVQRRPTPAVLDVAVGPVLQE